MSSTNYYWQMKGDPEYQARLRERNRKRKPSLTSKLASCRANAKARGLSWKLSKEDATELVQGNCYYCNRPANPFNGIDRINSKKGYSFENVVSCCKICNYAKNDLDLTSFEAWIKDLTSHHKNDIMDPGGIKVLINIKIPDELYERLGKLNPQNPRHAAEQLVEKYAPIGYSSKSVVLSGAVLSRLQALLGEQIDSPEGLEASLRKAVSLKVGDVSVELSPSQRKGIQDNAAFFKQDPVEFAKSKVKQGLVAALGV